jgi:FKBP-type peptidyl-prolyl cis-trans isomerase 2
MPGGKSMAIENGKKVAFHYTLTVDGQLVQTTEGQEPLAYTHGSGEIIPGLSSELEGLQEGDRKTVQVAAEHAYGNVNPDAFKEIDRSSLPEDMEPQIGMVLQARSPDGREVLVRISDVREDAIVIDLNHPLAGKDLKFDIKVVSVE